MSVMIFPYVNTDADVCVAVVVNVVGVVDQAQDQLADLSIAFCSSSINDDIWHLLLVFLWWFQIVWRVWLNSNISTNLILKWQKTLSSVACCGI